MKIDVFSGYEVCFKYEWTHTNDGILFLFNVNDLQYPV